MKVYYLYILKCSDYTYYTGMTSNLTKRLRQHKTGFFKKSYTANRLPVELVYYCSFQNVLDSIHKEKQIKKWSRSKKEALIEGRFKDLPNLAKKRFKD